jgi:hypothetical protein
MASADHKNDPIGDEFFWPLVLADYSANILFYISAALSIATLLVSQNTYPRAFTFVEVLFPLSVIALFLTTLAIRLYFAPRAQSRRYQDFLSHAFAKPFSHRQTAGYYNNSAPIGIARVAAQVLESSFFSHEIVARMTTWERIKIASYLSFWMIAVLNRNTDLALISLAAQIVFSEQIISRWLRLEWLRRECEKIYDDAFRLVQSGHEPEMFTLEILGRYEIAKATAGISLSTKIFERNRLRLNAEWDKIRATLGI